MAEATAGTISVVCSCGKKLKAPATAVGKKAKCPKCGNVLTVAPPPPPPAEDDSLDALYDLAQESEQHAAQQQMAPRCPGCMREMAPNAVLCTNCGYDTRRGKAIAPKVEGTKFDPAAAAAAVASGKNQKKVVDKMAPQGPFWKGLLASGGGAAIGAVIWILIAYGTGYSGMLPVLLVAILAGLGMQWGQEGYSYLGGFTAMAITFVVMIAARLAVIVALVIPMMRSEFKKAERQAAEETMPDLSQYDDRVVQKYYVEVAKTRKPVKAAAPAPAPAASDEDEDEDEDAEGEEEMTPYEKEEVAIYQEVEKKLKALPKAQYDAMVAKLDAEEKARELQQLVTEDILLTVIRVHPSRASSVEHQQAHHAAKEKIAAMTPAQRDAEHKRLNAENEKAEAKALAEAKKEMAERRAARGKEGEDADRAAARAGMALGAVVIFFMVFGGIRGGILMLIALGLAYRTASGSVSD